MLINFVLRFSWAHGHPAKHFLSQPQLQSDVTMWLGLSQWDVSRSNVCFQTLLLSVNCLSSLFLLSCELECGNSAEWADLTMWMRKPWGMMEEQSRRNLTPNDLFKPNGLPCTTYLFLTSFMGETWTSICLSHCIHCISNYLCYCNLTCIFTNN